MRSTPAPKAHYQEVHSDDVTTLSFHPSTPALLLSGSTDGLVNVYDTRVADEDELTLQTLNHGASIHAAGFLGAAGDVYALSHDEQFALYDVAEERLTGDATRSFGDLRSVLGCQYVAGVTPKTDGSGAVIGVGAQECVSSLPVSPLCLFLCVLVLTGDAAGRTFGSTSWRGQRTGSRGCWTWTTAWGCRARTVRRLFGRFASLTRSSSCSQRARTATSKRGGQAANFIFDNKLNKPLRPLWFSTLGPWLGAVQQT